MRSLRLLLTVSGASMVAMAAVLAGCSSAAMPTGPILQQQEPGASDNGGSGSGSSSGGSDTVPNGGGSSGSGSSSGGATASSGSGSSSGSSSGGTAAGGSTISADTTWSDGTNITEATTIAAGVTVTVASGATINVSSGVAITVKGTLTATTSTTHAKLTGTSWTGIVLASGGTLTADSLDITGASTPIDVSGTATYSNGTITGATVPISVETGGALTLDTVTVTGTLGSSRVNGNLTASHLDYERSGEGVTIGNAASVVKIDNSTFHGADDTTGDMIVTNACASLTMTYTAITGCHCAYHFNDIVSFDLENMDLHGDSYGFMMYGSSPTSGTRVFKNSNVETMAASGISESGTNGAISVTGVYFDSSSSLQLSDQEITVTQAAKAALPATEVGPQ